MSSDDNNCEEAKLYFVFPPDGYVSDGGSLKVVFGADNIAINPAGLEEDAVECVISGHHHLIINDEYNVSVFKDVAIPFKKTSCTLVALKQKLIYLYHLVNTHFNLRSEIMNICQ